MIIMILISIIFMIMIIITLVVVISNNNNNDNTNNNTNNKQTNISMKDHLASISSISFAKGAHGDRGGGATCLTLHV